MVFYNHLFPGFSVIIGVDASVRDIPVGANERLVKIHVGYHLFRQGAQYGFQIIPHLSSQQDTLGVLNWQIVQQFRAAGDNGDTFSLEIFEHPHRGSA